ncbi:hypothetical protein ABT124_40115 [Streptomyces sp. NPDC001982]|uniref:hypothetical protein n=1 Tax=Streptomyces sp. NPDC001982 TaxID=3154405 RepID=UPI003327D5C8
MHLVEPLREFIADHADWLTVFQLPSYSPDLNPQGHLVAGQARYRQPRRSRPRPDHPCRQAQAQADPVPPRAGRWLSGRRRLDHGRLAKGGVRCWLMHPSPRSPPWPRRRRMSPRIRCPRELPRRCRR